MFPFKHPSTDITLNNLRDRVSELIEELGGEFIVTIQTQHNGVDILAFPELVVEEIKYKTDSRRVVVIRDAYNRGH